MDLSILEAYKEELIQAFINVCEDEGYTVNKEQLNEDEVLQSILCGCVQNMTEVLDSDIANMTLSMIDGVESK